MSWGVGMGGRLRRRSFEAGAMRDDKKCAALSSTTALKSKIFIVTQQMRHHGSI